MDKEELRIILDILITGEEVGDVVDMLLFQNKDSVPVARGINDGFFGKLTKLTSIVCRYSPLSEDAVINILCDENLSKNKKMKKILGD